MKQYAYASNITYALFFVSVFFGAIQFSPAKATTELTLTQSAAFSCATVTEIPQAECEALVALYSSTAGENWFIHDGWLSTNTPCSWFEVHCESGHVTELYLIGNNLAGPIPLTLSNLTHLRVLHLAGNQLSETIPGTLGSFLNLEGLFLDQNQLTGAIPPTLGNLTRLKALALWNNQLSGVIPATLGNLTNLEQLYLSNNQLSGGIPTELGNLTKLRDLHLGGNRLHGTLPPALANLSNLEDFRLAGNQLADSLPAWIGNLTKLRYLHLDENQFVGTIPPVLGQLSQLERLDLSNNQLSGPIPPELGNLSLLLELRLWNNQLSGTLPASLGNLSRLETFHVGGNRLTGTFPDFVLNFADLRQLELWGNHLPGTIPPAIGTLSKLEWLSLGGIGLTGTIPEELGQLVNLRMLFLDWNQLTGAIPPTLGNLTMLQEFSLWNNRLSGVIPATLGSMTNLEELYLFDNQLSGGIPNELGNLTNLRILHLGENRLNGTLPAALANLSKLEDFRVAGNQLSGALPLELMNLAELKIFHTFNTALCQPDEPSVQNWLATIPYAELSGFICGQTPGAISGSVTDSNGQPLAGIEVSVYRNFSGPTWNTSRLITGTKTTADGAYHLGDLVGEKFQIFFADPLGTYGDEYFDNQGSLQSATLITVLPGATTTVDAVLDAPVPPVIQVETQAGVTTDTKSGEVIITMPWVNRSAVRITRNVACDDGSIPSNVELVVSGSSGVKRFTMNPSSSPGSYVALIEQAEITGNSTLRVTAMCGSLALDNTVGKIQLYDPSGVITDATTGGPISGAKVVLYHVPGWRSRTSADDTAINTCESNDSKPPSAAWSQPAPIDLGVLINPDLGTVSPAVNQMATDNQGRYGWDVAKGCWYVVVTAVGYATKISPVVGVPPEVVDLDLSLERVGTWQDAHLPLVGR